MSAERDAWVEEMRQENRHLRAQLEASTRQLQALAAERDAARGALRLALRAAVPLEDLCRRLLADNASPSTVAPTMERLLRDVESAVALARKEVL